MKKQSNVICATLAMIAGFILLPNSAYAETILKAHWSFEETGEDGSDNGHTSTSKGGAAYSENAVEGSHSLSLSGQAYAEAGAFEFGFLIATNPALPAQVPEQDSLALVALYNSTDGANWTNHTNWLTGNLDSWYGITVNEGRVTQINLNDNNLTGTLPADIGLLEGLYQLSLSLNQLTGSIPAEIGKLTQLRSFYLNDNKLGGSIPAEIQHLTNLWYINLSKNQFSNSIPPEIGNMANLIALNLSFNQFTGSIPPEIGNLAQCKYLYLDGNQLTGPIPPQIGNLGNLVYLYLSENQLTGSIPPEIGNLVLLEQLYLCFNQLSGFIPSILGNLTNCQRLSLYSNQFSGGVPSELTALTQLLTLDLCYNLLVDLPNLSLLSSLNNFTVHNNQLTFEDIEPNVTIPNFFYSPQDSVGTRMDTSIVKGAGLTMSVSVGGTANRYQWMKDGSDIPSENSNTYLIASADAANSGAYICRITNTLAPELTLYSRPVNVTVTGSTGVAQYNAPLPQTYELHQNYPNPFNPATAITFDIPLLTHVQIEVFNLKGQRIRTLVDAMVQSGRHSIQFNGQDDAGEMLSSGIYLYSLKAEDFRTWKKFTLLK